MKSILYVGAALMAAAGIYGFVDYNKTSRNKEFQSLYNEKEKVEVIKPAPATDLTETKKLKAESDLPVPVPEITGTDLKKSGAGNKSIKKKLNRKLNYKKFSRAPLREEIEIVPEKSK
jgi:hypothetical protein